MSTQIPRLKRCANCGETKPVTGFSRNRQALDGLSYYCKECAQTRQKAWATANPDKAKAAREKYRNRIRATNALQGNPYDQT